MTLDAGDLWATALSNSAVALGLAVLALAAGRFRKDPAVAHVLWVLVLVKLVTPPLWEVHLALPDIAAPPVAEVLPPSPTPAMHPGPVPWSPPAPADRLPRPPGAAFDWAVLWLAIWGGGALLALGVALFRAARFHRGLRHARPASPAVRAEADRIAARLGLCRAPAVRVIPGRLSPMLWGFFGPAQVLLPQQLAHTLSAERRLTLLAHELAHLQRRDHWVRVLELLVRAVHWWNPLAHWACARLRQVEEQCCDARVLQALPEAARSYADALLDTAEFLSHATDTVPAPASGIGTATNLHRRLTMIMTGDTDIRGRLGRSHRLAILGLAALTLPLVPAIAQDARQDEVRAQARTHDHEREVARALEHAIALLTKNRHERDAKTLTELLHAVRHRAHGGHDVPRHDVARHDGEHRTARLHEHQQQLDMTERHLAKLTDRLNEAEHQGRKDEAARLREDLAKAKTHAEHLHKQHQEILHDEERARVAEVHARDRLRHAEEMARVQTDQANRVARELAQSRDREALLHADRVRAESLRTSDRRIADAHRDDQRIAELEARIDQLTQAVHRLLEQSQAEGRRREEPPRRDRRPDRSLSR